MKKIEIQRRPSPRRAVHLSADTLARVQGGLDAPVPWQVHKHVEGDNPTLE